LNTKLKTILDWDAGREDFARQIKNMIRVCQENHKVLPLPFPITPGEAFAGQLGLLLAMVNCDGCEAICCRQETAPDGEGIGLTPDDLNLFIRVGAGPKLKNGSEAYYLEYPCPFFTGVKGRGCRVYQERPFSCIAYPFQPGGAFGEEGETMVLSVASDCPEGRRITADVYMHTWRVRQKFKKIGGYLGN
jgi:Fe-S-cluster containining protein